MLRLLSVIALVFVNGCASSPEKLSTPKEPAKPVTTAETPVKAKTKQSEAKTSIDPDVLFMLLSAEIAGQRGQYDVALEGYLEAAKRVHDPRFAERAAMIAMYMKDSKKTKQAVALWLKQDPENLMARKISALASLRAKNREASLDHLSVMLRVDPAGFENSVLELATVLQKEDTTGFLYDVLETLAQKKPEQAVIYFVQSVLAMQQKNKDLAETKIEQALRIQPDWDKAMIFQAQIAIFTGDLNKAASLLRNAASKYPENEKINKLFAQVLIKSAEYEEAGEVYQRIIAANPKDGESQIALGLVHLQLDQDDKAEDVFKQLLEQAEWKDQASFYLGKLEEKQDNVQKALDWFDKVKEGPFAFEASMSAVSLLAKNKQFEQAESRLNPLRSRFPEQKLRITLMQAELLSQQKQYQKGFDLLTAALADQPDSKDLLYTRALMAERIGKLDILEADLKKILASNPDSAETLNALGYTLLDYPDRYAEAEKYLLRALQLQPDEPVIMDSYGWLQFKLGNPVKALVFLEQAYAKQQENEIAAHLAEVLWALGRKDEARKLFNKAFKAAPEDEYLLDFKQRILKDED